MRILTITNTPHNPNQGSGYAICNYTEGLRARGHTVDAYGPDDYRALLNVNRGKRYVYPLTMAAFGLRKAAEKDYDLVECWGGTSWLLSWLLSAGGRDFALAHHSNGIEPHADATLQHFGEMGLVQKRQWFQVNMSPLYAAGFRSADTIITLSEFDAAYARRKRYISPKDVHAIDDPLPEAYLDQNVNFERDKRIGYCGMWIERKGTKVMKSDVATFLRAHPDWTFSLAGVGEDFDPHVHFPAAVQEQIEVKPFVPREELISWYGSLAIFLCPSTYESFGLVQTEAMACGAALVATETAGYAASLEDRQQCMKLPAPQSPHLIKALDTLADDEDMRQRIAQKGYETVQSLRWAPAVDRLEVIYEDLVRRKKSVTA